VSFSHPILLLLLLAIPAAAAGHVWLEKRRDARASAWAPPALLPNMVSQPPAWRRHVPIALLLLGAASLLVGFARPQTSIRVKRQDATGILVLDVSGSMAANDTRPTRLGAARAAAERFGPQEVRPEEAGEHEEGDASRLVRALERRAEVTSHS